MVGRQLLYAGVMELEIHHLATTIVTVNSGKRQEMLQAVGEGGEGNRIPHCVKAPPHETCIKYKEGESITLSGETCRPGDQS